MAMTHRERVIAALRKQPADRLPYLIRMDQWYNWHLVHGTLPDKYKGWDAFRIIRDIGGGIHPHRYYRPGVPPPRAPRSQSRGLYKEEIRNVEVKVTREGDTFTTQYGTPRGTLRLVERFTPESEGGSSIEAEHLFKSDKDYQALEFVFANTEVTPDYEPYNQLQRELGEDGIPIASIGDSPVHHLMRVVMGYDRFFFELADNPARVEGLLKVMEEVWVKRARVLAGSPAITVQIGGNWSDSIHTPIFRRFMTPYFRKVGDILHVKGKLTQVHVDGEMRRLLPLFLETGIDTAEAVAPHPMTSVTVGEFRKAFGDKVTIWGGLPSVIFLPSYSDKEFEQYVMNLLREIKPGYNFILGMGDNVPATGVFSRVRRVVEILDKHGKLPLSV
jgi:uroporphyrinogen-III decarboxylase